MTSKRFKAVCTETGREFGTDDLVCGGYVRDDLYKPIGLYWSVEFQDKNQAAIDSILCQSTGLTDAKGQEVYEGDIILVYFPRTDFGYVYSVFFDRGGFKLEGFYFPGQERPGGQRHWLGIEVLLDAIENGAKLHCVGNRWMPAAELQARAEAVSKQ